MNDSVGRPSGRLRSFAHGLPGVRLWYEALDRLDELQRELQKANKRLLKLQHPELKTPKEGVPDRDSVFLEAVAAAGDRSKLDRDRLWVLWQAARNAAPLGLPVLESGSYRGGSAYFLAHAFVAQLGHEVPLDAIDTFEGHPGEQLTDKDHVFHAAGMFGDARFEDVREYLSTFSLARVHKGEFSAVAPTLTHESYGLVHLDMDLYLPTIEALRFSADRLAAGGVVVLDDYGARKCPGIREAAEEFLSEHPEFQSWHPHTEQLVLIRLR
jgi:O-methyltransferase